jgi:hypothetical protein
MTQRFEARRPLEVLRATFGYESFRGHQAAIVSHVMPVATPSS